MSFSLVVMLVYYSAFADSCLGKVTEYHYRQLSTDIYFRVIGLLGDGFGILESTWILKPNIMSLEDVPGTCIFSVPSLQSVLRTLRSILDVPFGCIASSCFESWLTGHSILFHFLLNVVLVFLSSVFVASSFSVFNVVAIVLITL